MTIQDERTTDQPTHLSADEFKTVFRQHPAGVAVVALRSAEGHVGFTATSVISVSAAPPLLAFSIAALRFGWIRPSFMEGEPMLEHDFTPLFKLDHMLKDVLLCLEESRSAGASFPFAGLAGELYSAGVGRGLGQEDFATVLEVVEGLGGSDSS